MYALTLSDLLFMKAIQNRVTVVKPCSDKDMCHCVTLYMSLSDRNDILTMEAICLSMIIYVSNNTPRFQSAHWIKSFPTLMGGDRRMIHGTDNECKIYSQESNPALRRTWTLASSFVKDTSIPELNKT